MKQNRKKLGQKSLLQTLDPKIHSRLPDNYFSVIDLPGKPARFMKFDLSDDGVISTIDITFPEGARPRKAYIQATKDVFIYDALGHKLKPERYHIETYRERNSDSKKKKLVSIVPGLTDRITVNTGHIFNSFDAVVSIDTNTYEKDLVGGDKLSVLGVSISRKMELKYPELLEITARHAIEFRNLKDPKEKHGWFVGLHKMYTSGLLKPEWKVAVIVDSYANEVMSFNNGAEIVAGFRLTPEIKFVYASADTGQFFALNKCMKAADKLAKMVMDKLVMETSLHNLRNALEHEPYTGIRLWQTKEIGGSLRLISDTTP